MSLKICSNYAYFIIDLLKFHCHYGGLGPSKTMYFNFVPRFSLLGSFLSHRQFKSYGYLKFGCCLITRQYALMRLRNMLQVCLFFGKSEPYYAYQRYLYIKMNCYKSIYLALACAKLLYKANVRQQRRETGWLSF